MSLTGLVREGQANLIRHGAYPLYNPSMSHRESKEDIERLGEYCADTHSEYVKLSHKRWTDTNTLVRQAATTENQQVARSLADLAYQVRQSTSFRTILMLIYQHQQTRITEIVEQMDEISRFYRCALTVIQAAAKFYQDVTYICVKTPAIFPTSYRLGKSSSSDLKVEASNTNRNGNPIFKAMETIPLRISFQSVSEEDNFKRALSSLCDNVRAKVDTISTRICYRLPFHIKSVANFTRANLK